MSPATWLLTPRTLIQCPRNPMVLGSRFAPVLMMFVVFGALFESVKISRASRPTTTSSLSRRPRSS